MSGLLIVTVIAVAISGLGLMYRPGSRRRQTGGARRILAVTFLVIAPALLAGGLVSARRAKVEAAPTPTQRPTPVRTAEAIRGDLEDTRQFLGRVLAWQTAGLSSQIIARIIRLDVREGDPVRKGQSLAILDDEEIRSAVAGVEAQISEADAQVEAQRATVESLKRTVEHWRRELGRASALVEQGALAQSAADATEERFQEAQGRLEAAIKTLEATRRQGEALGHRFRELQSRHDYTKIRSPFDGFVTRRLTDPGDLAVPGKELLIIEDHSRLRIAFDVPQDEMEQIDRGTRVRLADRGMDLQVDRLYPSLNPDRTRTMEAFAPPDSGLRSGTFHSLEIVLRRLQNVTLVPEPALLPLPDGGHTVFTVYNGTTRSVPVRRLLVRNGVAAVEGLTAGTPVILSTYLGWNRLSDGEPVEVIR